MSWWILNDFANVCNMGLCFNEIFSSKYLEMDEGLFFKSL